jgi:hypothetical protein
MLIRRPPRNVPHAEQEKVHMESNASDLVVGLMMAVFGLIGLFLAAGAADSEMYVFGLALSGFALCFNFGLIRRHYDRLEAARAMAAAKLRELTHV